jgi:hypothetical protein
MTSQITISASYTCVATGSVDLKTWGDVKDWYIKWDTLHVQFEGDESWVEFGIESDSTDGVDWKRPAHVDIYEGEFEFDVDACQPLTRRATDATP